MTPPRSNPGRFLRGICGVARLGVSVVVFWAILLIFPAGVVSAQPAPVFGPPLPDVSGGRAVMPESTSPITPWIGDAFGVSAPEGLNPIDVLGAAARALPGATGGAQSGSRPGLSSAMSILILLTVITLIPSIMLMCTCFVRIIIVLGLLRQAIGAQSIPPPQVVTALALFMTMIVMAPTADRVYREAVVPYQAGTLTETDQLWLAARQPVRDFMFSQIDATGNWSSVYMVLNYRGIDTSDPSTLTRADVDMVTLIPAFLLSELKTAFLMGFKLYLPFLVIDMVISAMLISMSMMMLPPVLISLPFKVLLFVLVDGWSLVAGSLMASFVQPGASPEFAVLLQQVREAAPLMLGAGRHA